MMKGSEYRSYVSYTFFMASSESEARRLTVELYNFLMELHTRGPKERAKAEWIYNIHIEAIDEADKLQREHYDRLRYELDELYMRRELYYEDASDTLEISTGYPSVSECDFLSEEAVALVREEENLTSYCLALDIDLDLPPNEVKDRMWSSVITETINVLSIASEVDGD
jgi:hypothetical protein